MTELADPRAPKPAPSALQLELALAARESNGSTEISISTCSPYFPTIDTPLSLISENKWSIIGAVAGDMIRAGAPKSMIKMFRVHSEQTRDHDELMELVKRWVETS